MMEIVKLGDICRPKQWKTIPMSKLKEEGYSVYGANGVIGYYDEYTHENPTVLITCRGATCGTINISEPKSYINGNAMALDNLSSDCDLYYLAYYLKERGFHDVISGSAQPQITREGLKKVEIPLPSLSVQQAIAAQLDQARELVQYHHQLLEKYDELQQSLFLEMFGDPVLNEKGWERKRLEEVAEIIMGQSPKGTSYNEEGIGSPLLNGPTEFGEKYPIEKQWTTEPKKFSKKGDILFCVRGATAGRMNWSDKEYCIGRGLAAIRPLKNISFGSDYLYKFLEGMYQVFQETSDGSTFINISSKDLRSIKIPNVPLSLQNEFASYIESIEYQKSLVREALQQSEDVFNGLLQESFG